VLPSENRCDMAHEAFEYGDTSTCKSQYTKTGK
jgi:hypothetical protein